MLLYLVVFFIQAQETDDPGTEVLNTVSSGWHERIFSKTFLN